MKNITNTLDTLAKNHNKLVDEMKGVKSEVLVSSCCGHTVDEIQKTCGACGEHAEEVTLDKYYE